MSTEFDPTIEKALGRNLARAMDRAGIRPSELASKMGVTAQTITNWRARGVAATHGDAVARLLGVDPGKISRVEAVGAVHARAAGVVASATVTAPTVATGAREELLAALLRADLAPDDLRLITALIQRLGDTG